MAVGQPLIQLDTTQAQAEQRIIEGRAWAKAALVARLASERDGFSEVVFSEDLLAQEDERARAAIANESALFVARRADRLGETAVLNQRVAQLRNQIEGTSAVIDAKKQISDSLQVERSELAQLLEEGYVDKQRIRQLERSLAETLGELADLNAQVAAAKVAIEETELQILQLDKRFKTKVVDALTAAQEEPYDMQQRLLAINDRLQRTLLLRPSNRLCIGP